MFRRFITVIALAALCTYNLHADVPYTACISGYLQYSMKQAEKAVPDAKPCIDELGTAVLDTALPQYTNETDANLRRQEMLDAFANALAQLEQCMNNANLSDSIGTVKAELKIAKDYASSMDPNVGCHFRA